MTNEEKEYCDWIRLGPCIVCEAGNWNDQLGQWCNTVSHIKTKGSGGKIFNNIVSMCIFCHRAYEDGLKHNREKYLKIAERMTETWKSRLWWKKVNELQK